MGFLDDDPALGSLLVKDALGAGDRALERRARVLDVLIGVVDRGRTEAKGSGPRGVPPLTAEGVVGAVLGVIHARVLEHDSKPLVGLVNPLMGMIVMPYLGSSAARRELHRPTPRRHAGARPRRDALRDLDMRLTYRTVMVLGAIAASPGISNRQVAQDAGVHDQGQMSKLLARLQHLGLIHNTGHGQPKGEPNAWTLTPKGRDVHDAVAIQPAAR